MLRGSWLVRIVLVVTALGAVSTLVVATDKTPEGAKYVGTGKCRLCHMKEYKSWQKTKHSKTWEDLRKDERKKDDCVKCHVTGFGKESGFVSEEKTAHLTNVGCEACHGPGSEHVKVAPKLARDKDADRKIDKTPVNKCIQCHNPHVRQGERAKSMR
jgi:hypothetical protein